MNPKALSLLLATLIAANVAASDCTPVQGRQYALAGESVLIAAFDVDGDGDADLLTPTRGTKLVAVLVNRGDGFVPGAPIALPHPVFDVTLADVDGDGNDELLAVDAQGISTIESNGSVVTTTVANTTNAIRIATGDLTGDGRIDLAIANTAGVQVFRGNGNGTFTGLGLQKLNNEIVESVSSIAVAELTGDSKGDLLLVYSPLGLTVAELRPGNGDGTFGAPRVLDSNTFGRLIAAGDYDGDGRADILMDHGLLLRASDNFTTRHEVPCAGTYIVADLDSDGKLDGISSAMDVCRGNGSGGFTNVWSGAGGWSFVWAELNGDGRPDLATVDGTVVSIYHGKPDGTFDGSTRRESARARHAVVADVDADGKDDFILQNDFVSVYRGQADGTFAAGMGAAHGAAAVADFDGDSHLDLFIGPELLRGRGDGTFPRPQSNSSNGSELTMRAADLNRDHLPEAIATSPSSSAIFVWSSPVPSGQVVSYPAGHRPRALAVADVNRDGIPDVLTAGREEQNGPKSLRLSITRPDGTLAPSVEIGDGIEGIDELDLLTADFDGDTNTDVAFATAVGLGDWDRSIVILRGAGNGTFTEWQRVLLPRSRLDRLFRIATGDFNGDGRPDLAAKAGIELWLLIQQPDRTFHPSATLLGDSYIGGMAAGDFNGDGVEDLASIASYAGRLDLHLGRCSGSGSEEILLKLTTSATSLTATLNAPVNAGLVTFYKGEEVLGSAPVVNGRATLPTNTLAKGSHTIHARFSGAGPVLRETSNVVRIEVTDAVPAGRRRSVRH